MTAGEPPKLQLPIRCMLELEHAEKARQGHGPRRAPSSLTDDELKEIIAIAGEDAPLFDPDPLELDGWRRDHNRHWIPPDIHAIERRPRQGSRRAAANASGPRLRVRNARQQQHGSAEACRAHPHRIPRRVRSYKERRAEGNGGRTTERTGFTAGTGGPT